MHAPSPSQPGAQPHAHSHAPARATVRVGASLLRMSVVGRLAIAAVGVALIWAGVYLVTG